MDRAAIYGFLRRQRYAVVSSLSPDLAPQSALVGIAVAPQLDIVFDTPKTSRKYPNLTARPSCSLVLGWEDERTVQLEGVAFVPAAPELRAYQEIYFAAWPEGAERMSWPDIAWVVVRPRWIRYSDFGRNPPLIAELSLA